MDGDYDFESQTKPSEPTGFNLEEKNSIIETLCDFGIPIVNDESKKYDW